MMDTTEREGAEARALPEQALAALRELLRGVERADRDAGGALLRGFEGERLRHVHSGLVATIMRLVFVLFAEARGLLPLDANVGPLMELYSDLTSRTNRGSRAWTRLSSRFRALQRSGDSFDADALRFFEAGASDETIASALKSLLFSGDERVRYEALEIEQLGGVYEGLIGFELRRGDEAQPTLILEPGQDRRKSGSHYTPNSLTAPIVEATLRPIVARLGDVTAERIFDLKVCDPAMGGGAFLVEACRQLAEHLISAWRRGGAREADGDEAEVRSRARTLVARRSLYGVDKNPLAVEIARRSLWLVAGAKDCPLSFVNHALRVGDSLVGGTRLTSRDPSDELLALEHEAVARARGARSEVRSAKGCPTAARLAELLRANEEALRAARDAADRAVAARAAEVARHPFHWHLEFPEAFSGTAPDEVGFTAIVGNPPWVSYAGRAAQPLDDRLRSYFSAHYESFAGYRNLQALFVERTVGALLAPGGRAGLVVPSSMAELDGYRASRAAHDRFAECDAELPDLGEDRFHGVFQPSMVLHSTRRDERRAHATGAPWPIARPDLDDEARRILAELEGPRLPPGLFGERGFQSAGDDVRHLCDAPKKGTVPIRIGADIQAFRTSDASLHAETKWFGPRLRPASEWRTVDVLIRQTARVPIAAKSDGAAFRNSILAGFEDKEYPAEFLVAYLNSTPVRWVHYHRHRDARLGMPQVKIGHLRSIPAPRRREVIAALADFGAMLSRRNTGVSALEQRRLDELVAAALCLSSARLERMRRDAEAWS